MKGVLTTIDMVRVWGEIVRIVRDPWANTTASLLLLGIVLVALMIVATLIIGIIATVTAKPRKSEELEMLLAYLAVLEGREPGSEDLVAEQRRNAVPRPPLKERLRDAGRSAGIALAVSSAVLLLLTIALGATTSASEVCTACHVSTPHLKAVRSGVTDPHKDVGCVDCHESSGLTGHLLIDVPARLRHYATGWQSGSKPAAYGGIVSSACLRCHRGVMRETTQDEQRGVRMAHVQPVEAGAECRSCHTAGNGVVSSLTVGMAPCLRCHDGAKQPTKCALCHTKDISVATRSHADPTALKGRELMPTPDCAACHDMKAKCDPCHGGVRMPHTKVFMTWAHARSAAEDIWFNGGAACGRCHGPERRPCTKCHSFLPTPGHGSTWAKLHQNAQSSAACDTCHGSRKYVNGRDFCKLCHGTRIDQ